MKSNITAKQRLFKGHILPNENYLSACLSDHSKYIPTFHFCPVAIIPVTGFKKYNLKPLKVVEYSHCKCMQLGRSCVSHTQFQFLLPQSIQIEAYQCSSSPSAFWWGLNLSCCCQALSHHIHWVKMLRVMDSTASSFLDSHIAVVLCLRYCITLRTLNCLYPILCRPLKVICIVSAFWLPSKDNMKG